MKKVFGIEAEINITTDDDVAKGIGKGLSNGTVVITDIIKQVKPDIVKGLQTLFKEKQLNGTDKPETK